MAEKRQLPYLVRLLEDDSPRVREHVVRELMAFGSALEQELQAIEPPLPAGQLSLLRSILASYRTTASHREAWLSWPSLPTEREQLEAAFELLAEFQYGWRPPVYLRELLDDLANDFLISGRPIDPMGLSRFLFITKKFRGNLDDYYNPLNNNLFNVIQGRRGVPITLACVFILVGARVGLHIEGCNLPGHFLARVRVNQERLLIDCFNAGRVLTRPQVMQLRTALKPKLLHLLDEAPTPVEIIAQVVRNLANAYELAEDVDKGRRARELLSDLVQETQTSKEIGAVPSDQGKTGLWDW